MAGGVDLIALVDADGTIRASNDAPGRLTGRSVLDLVHAEDVHALREALETPDATTRVEARVRFGDGEWRVVEASVANLLDDPNVAGLVLSMHDVTDGRRSEAMLRSVVENLNDVVLVLDDRFEVTWSTSDEGRNAFDGVHAEDVDRVRDTLSRVAAGPLGERARVELRLEGRWIEATIVNRLNDPAVLGLVCTLRDVTDAKAASAELQSAFDRLRELDTMKEQFLASVSHEMRTPLAVIIGFADLLRRGDHVDPTIRWQAVDRIRASAAELRSMVENLLDFSALEAGKLSVVVAPVRVARTVEAAMHAVSALVIEHPVMIEVPSDLWALADAEGLDRTLRNLVANAARYSERGRPITIEARLAEDESEVVVDVTDEGIGIPEEQRELVFERLYRGPGAAFVARGTGVGLNLVKRYVELMGGEVSVRSTVGEGSTFSVRLRASAGA